MAQKGTNAATMVNVSSNEQKTSSNNDGQPPQQPPTEKKTPSSSSDRVRTLLKRLREIIDKIRKYWERNYQSTEEFRRETFFEMYSIVSELISSGYSISISPRNNELVISHNGEVVEVIEYLVADYLDVHDQLIRQEFDLDPTSTCPTILSARFRNGRLVLQSTQEGHRQLTNAIYGVRCRLCDRRAGPCNINYVGQTTQSVHDRLCGQHARAVAEMVFEDGRYRPMYQHAADHFTNGDLPRGTPGRDIFRHVMDVIILPTGADGDLRSWECFWQFFLHCRDFFWGWSQR